MCGCSGSKRWGDESTYVYEKPWFRIPAYLIGMLAAVFWTSYRPALVNWAARPRTKGVRACLLATVAAACVCVTVRVHVCVCVCVCARFLLHHSWLSESRWAVPRFICGCADCVAVGVLRSNQLLLEIARRMGYDLVK